MVAFRIAKCLLLALACHSLLLQTVASKSKRRAKKSSYNYDPNAGYEMKGNNYTLSDVRDDFLHEFQGFADAMLCSACKLSSAQFAIELASKEELDSKQGEHVVKVLVRVWNQTCSKLPDPLVGVPGEGGPEFRALVDVEKEDKELASRSRGNAERSGVMAGRLCSALLHDFREPLFQELEAVYAKGKLRQRRWERFFCGLNHGRLCKMQDLDDVDIADEDDGANVVADSVTKRREAEEAAHVEKVVAEKVSQTFRDMSKMNNDDLASYLDKILRTEL